MTNKRMLAAASWSRELMARANDRIDFTTRASRLRAVAALVRMTRQQLKAAHRAEVEAAERRSYDYWAKRTALREELWWVTVGVAAQLTEEGLLRTADYLLDGLTAETSYRGGECAGEVMSVLIAGPVEYRVVRTSEGEYRLEVWGIDRTMVGEICLQLSRYDKAGVIMGSDLKVLTNYWRVATGKPVQP